MRPDSRRAISATRSSPSRRSTVEAVTSPAASLVTLRWFVANAATWARCVTAITWLLLYTTQFGRHLYAVGGDPEAARLSGINTRKYLMLAYVYCGLLSGVTGLLLSSRVNSGTPNLGQAGMMLDSIAVVVIGGVTFSGGEGHLAGVVCGVILLAILSNGFDLTGVSSFVKMLVTGAIICLAIIVDKYRKG